ncbi:hypothetical protein GCM10010303_79620 [Streptomyces purpurascens]|nr:hypothetical protein GCM10010303_79620 [Streptomyces purpurascens]
MPAPVLAAELIASMAAHLCDTSRPWAVTCLVQELHQTLAVSTLRKPGDTDNAESVVELKAESGGGGVVARRFAHELVEQLPLQGEPAAAPLLCFRRVCLCDRCTEAVKPQP